jgi:CRP-like cAMP-binding protein
LAATKYGGTARYRRGDLFGEISFLCGMPQMFTVTAATDNVTLAAFDVVSFQLLFVKFPGSFRFVSLRFASFRFVSFRFVSFRFVSFRFVSFRFVSFRFADWLQSLAVSFINT